MKSSSSRSCHLLLLSLLGLLTICAQLLGTSGQNATVAAGKTGTCPDTEVATAHGNCTEECQSDAGCEGSQKCCRTGCGTSCRTPNDKPGSCPGNMNGISMLGFCGDNKCASDAECEGTKKCCQNGCGRKDCTTPD
ncbi:WAP four-disulfide core domain protein 3 [Elgaria multicarinata webbii]|uniref:WAP four-disulfide core domain protein 3 n=1 Tax=Elgaria multicarinata webbii TaxID=159646 RepID=UPI002FCD4A2B